MNLPPPVPDVKMPDARREQTEQAGNDPRRQTG